MNLLDRRLVRLEEFEARRTAERLAAEFGVTVDAASSALGWVTSFRRVNGRLPTLAEVAREVAADTGVTVEAALAEVETIVRERGLG